MGITYFLNFSKFHHPWFWFVELVTKIVFWSLALGGAAYLVFLRRKWFLIFWNTQLSGRKSFFRPFGTIAISFKKVLEIESFFPRNCVSAKKHKYGPNIKCFPIKIFLSLSPVTILTLSHRKLVKTPKYIANKSRKNYTDLLLLEKHETMQI